MLYKVFKNKCKDENVQGIRKDCSTKWSNFSNLFSSIIKNKEILKNKEFIDDKHITEIE